MTPATRSGYFTVTDLSGFAKCKPQKVLKWINSGELRASNVTSQRTGKKPRWLIREVDWLAFLAGRANAAPITPAPRRRKLDAGITQYF